MLERFKEFIRLKELCTSGERILLAVSGGIDSVVMAHLFGESGNDCIIAHCNFQLRGSESDADEQFVRGLAARLEMPVYVRHFDVDKETREKGISVQMAARDLRYAWFDSLAEETACQAVATAHNLNDSVETCFLNLARGTGIRGMTGIPARNGNVIRPLLFASRNDIQSYALRNKISYREDSTNRETKYSRNKVRHDVIPSLEQVNPGFVETMTGNMKRFEEAAEILRHAVEQQRTEIFRKVDNRMEVDSVRLGKLEPASTWFYELFSPYGFTRSQCEGIRNILDAGPGKRFISSTHQLFKDRQKLILVSTPTASYERYYLDSPEKTSSLPVPMEVQVIARDDMGPLPADRDTACLDYDLIQFPLTIRHWLHGDYFFPLGMDQMKKLSDYFVDEKIPLPQKERIWILAAGKKIVWIMGYRIDHRFRVTDRTERVLMLRLS
jgi:tRNA(Ile)-lysidine synthase